LIAFLSDTNPVNLAEKVSMKLAAGLLVAATALCMMVLPLRAVEPETRVLILIATHPYVPALLALDNAMREELAKDTTQRFQFFSESLDAQRFAFGDFEQEFRALLAKKYTGLKIDLIVAVTKPALDFADRHGNDLWPGAQILFHSIPTYLLDGLVLSERTKGVREGRDIGRTLDLARRLQPDAQRILVVAGESDYDKDFAEETRRVLAARNETAETRYLIGLPQRELVETIAREPASTIVLYLSQFRDREGRPYTPREVLRAISAESVAPTYGVFETYLGYGVAAGIVQSYDDLGRTVAKLLIQMKAGASVPALSDVPAECVADARALKKWSLDEHSLPPGCEIRLAERPLWREYPLQIFSALAVLLLQAALIAWLLLERQRRKQAAEQMGRAQVETRQYRENLAHLVRVHAVGEMSAAITHEINQPLVAIKNYALAARRRLTGTLDAAKVEDLLDKIGLQASRAGDVLQSLRTMVRKHESETTRIEVGQLVADTLKLAEMESRSTNIRFESAISRDLPPILVDGVQIQQVVLNLIRNAIEAIEEAGITTSVIKVGVSCTTENEIAVSVTDHGPGIGPDDAKHIFEPFYSTKGGGLGVGLSISRAIIEAHGGRISLAPNVDGGCVFHFTLPVSHKGKLTA
jgi:signal transduction histidine kinase